MKERSTGTNLTKEDFIKEKTRKFLFFIDSIIFGILLLLIFLSCIFDNNTFSSFLPLMIIVSIIVTILNLTFKDFLYSIFNCDFDRLSSVTLVNNALSSQKYTEVIPIHSARKHTYFFASLTNIAKFYAILSNESSTTVTIYVLLNNEKEFRFLESIIKEHFYIYYKIK